MLVVLSGNRVGSRIAVAFETVVPGYHVVLPLRREWSFLAKFSHLGKFAPFFYLENA